MSGVSQPVALAFDSSGALYAANKQGSTVTKYTPGSTSPTATLTGLNGPDALAFDAAGNLYVANYFAGNSGTISVFHPGAVHPSATLTGVAYPVALAVDRNGNLFVANSGNASTTVSEFAPGATKPTASLTGLSAPDALAFDSSGNLYVANANNGTVSVFAPGMTIAATTLTGLDAPDALAFDSSGNLYVANSNEVAGTLSYGYTVTEFYPGTRTPSITLFGFNAPAALAFDQGGNLYVANNLSNTVTEVRLASSGLVGTDSYTALEVYNNDDVGSGKILGISGYAVNDGNGGNNYVVTTLNNTAGVINKAPLVITSTPNTKTYDSTTSASAIPTVSGLKGNDTVTALAEIYGNKNAGSSKTLSVSAYSINDGNNGNNYSVTTANITTGVIKQATLTLTAQANTKNYDATATAGATPTVSGLFGSDTVFGLAEVYGDPNVGSRKTLSVTAYTINDGNAGNNYSVTTVNNATGVINPGPFSKFVDTILGGNTNHCRHSLHLHRAGGGFIRKPG